LRVPEGNRAKPFQARPASSAASSGTEALAVKRARGERMGRASTLPAAVADRIVAERCQGATLQAIADRLNGDQVPTGQGGTRWRPSSVVAVLKSRGANNAGVTTPM
jgi:hypothetical protein